MLKEVVAERRGCGGDGIPVNMVMGGGVVGVKRGEKRGGGEKVTSNAWK